MLFHRFGKVQSSGLVNCETKIISHKRFDIKLFKLTAKLTTPVLAIAGIVGITLPSRAISTSYRLNDYRVCAARLLSLDIPAETASVSCASALSPREFSSCVGKIQRKTQIPAADSLSFCGQARRPNDLATCVVAISTRSEETANRPILSFCSRSLLPVNFAECVTGLRSEIDFSTTQAMTSCIDARDRISNVTAPSSTPRVTPSSEFSPTFETTPIR